MYLDNLTVRTDNNADGTYETTQLIEDFTLDSSGYAHETLTHDAAGNLTYDGVYAYAYDAWNRLVTVTKAYRDPASPSAVAKGSVVCTMQYDGQGRRIVKEVQNSADLDATYHYYYTGHQLIETRNGSDLPIKQHVWGPGYIDELAQVSLNDDPADQTEGDGTQSLCESHYYALQDANFNVLGVVDSSGVIVERYEYTPYGERQVFVSAGADDPMCYAPALLSKRWQVSGIDQPYGLNETGFQGLAHDESINGVHQRFRWWNTRLARFNQRDPLGYADGLNHYAGYHVMWGLVDPLGLQTATVPREVFDNEQWPGSESGVPRPGFPRLTENGVIRPVYLDGINEQEHDRIQRHNYLIVLLDIGAIDCDDLLNHRDYLAQYGPQYVAPVGSKAGLTAFDIRVHPTQINPSFRARSASRALLLIWITHNRFASSNMPESLGEIESTASSLPHPLPLRCVAPLHIARHRRPKSCQ